jgi:putative MATE family efflux protein
MVQCCGVRDRTKRILGIALPIIGGMVSQNVLNLVDLAMVATEGDAAVAAVGVGGFANFLAFSFITGLSASVQTIAARRKGEGRDSETALPLNAALLLGIVTGIPLSAVLYMLVPWFFPLQNPDPAVVEVGVPYLQVRLIAMVAVASNFAFRGYWNAVDLSKLYLRTLLVMHACNIFLNWVLIFGNLGSPALGAYGAGLSSAIATYIGTGFYVLLGLRHARGAGFLRSLPNRDTLRSIITLAVPNGLQQFAFAAGFNALFWILGHIGLGKDGHSTVDVAAANALVNVTLVALLPGIALGIAAASLVGQALGRKDPDDAYAWGWEVAKIAVWVMGGLGLPMAIAPDLVLSPFLSSADALAAARLPMRWVGLFIAFDGIGMVLMNAMLGAGANRTAMIVSVALQWGLFLPIAFVLGPILGFGLLPIWIAQLSYRALAAVAFAVLWKRRSWASIQV